MNGKTTFVMPPSVPALLAPVGMTDAAAQEAPGGIEDDTQKITVNELETDTDEQIHDIPDGFESGEFRKLFSDSDGGSVGTTPSVMPDTLRGKITPVHHGPWPVRCGGSFLDPHMPDPTPTTCDAGITPSGTRQILRNDGYHMTAEYASWIGAASQPYDSTKIVPSSNCGGLCDAGAFRDHAGINNDFSHTV